MHLKFEDDPDLCLIFQGDPEMHFKFEDDPDLCLIFQGDPDLHPGSEGRTRWEKAVICAHFVKKQNRQHSDS